MLYHSDLYYLLNLNDSFDLCYQHSQRIYSMINVCIIMMYFVGLYRVDKVIYEIIFSTKFP